MRAARAFKYCELAVIVGHNPRISRFPATVPPRGSQLTEPVTVEIIANHSKQALMHDDTRTGMVDHFPRTPPK
jgi:hypothetical protein